MMAFSREINRLLVAVLVVFSLVAFAAAYWGIVGSPGMLARPDNPRRVVAEARIQRGSIYDRDEHVLVQSLPTEDGLLARQYFFPETDGAVGYFSPRYGAGGAEAAYDTLLRGDETTFSLNTFFSQQLLHRPQTGSDIRLTLELTVQQTLANAMAGQQGAAIVLAVPSGEVLGMMSLPTYDPNTLEADWERLRVDPGKPFFNRILQGTYQPGGTLQTALIAAAILSGYSLDIPIDNATRQVQIEQVEVHCAAPLPATTLTLRQAYAFGCPYAFSQLGDTLGVNVVQAVFDTFNLDNTTTLPGFVIEPVENTPPTPILATLNQNNLLNNVLGQGALTTNPLEIAMMAAAIVNDGNAPQPYTLAATRPVGAAAWVENDVDAPSLPFMTTNVARQLQDMMRLAVAEGAAQNAARPNIDIGGHASLAYAGSESQAWFLGFTTLVGRQGVAIAVVLENSDDPGLAADIGGTTLAAAHAYFEHNP